MPSMGSDITWHSFGKCFVNEKTEIIFVFTNDIYKRACYILARSLLFFPGMRVYVRLAAHLRGRVGGLCGNFDGDTENDFTTRQGIIESTAELFGNSWKVSPSCPDVADQDLRDPCAVSHTGQCRHHGGRPTHVQTLCN